MGMVKTKNQGKGLALRQAIERQSVYSYYRVRISLALSCFLAEAPNDSRRIVGYHIRMAKCSEDCFAMSCGLSLTSYES